MNICQGIIGIPFLTAKVRLSGLCFQSCLLPLYFTDHRHWMRFQFMIGSSFHYRPQCTNMGTWSVVLTTPNPVTKFLIHHIHTNTQTHTHSTSLGFIGKASQISACLYVWLFILILPCMEHCPKCGSLYAALGSHSPTTSTSAYSLMWISILILHSNQSPTKVSRFWSSFVSSSATTASYIHMAV